MAPGLEPARERKSREQTNVTIAAANAIRAEPGESSDGRSGDRVFAAAAGWVYPGRARLGVTPRFSSATLAGVATGPVGQWRTAFHPSSPRASSLPQARRLEPASYSIAATGAQ